MKRASKGVNGGFRVPWNAGSPQHAEAQKQKEDTGNREEEEKVEHRQPAREPSADEQQIHQLMNAKKAIQAQARKEEAAQARAEAVKVSFLPHSVVGSTKLTPFSKLSRRRTLLPINPEMKIEFDQQTTPRTFSKPKTPLLGRQLLDQLGKRSSREVARCRM